MKNLEKEESALFFINKFLNDSTNWTVHILHIRTFSKSILMFFSLRLISPPSLSPSYSHLLQRFRWTPASEQRQLELRHRGGRGIGAYTRESPNWTYRKTQVCCLAPPAYPLCPTGCASILEILGFSRLFSCPSGCSHASGMRVSGWKEHGRHDVHTFNLKKWTLSSIWLNSTWAWLSNSEQAESLHRSEFKFENDGEGL